MVIKGRKYNIVIFGATGFTGKHVILEIIKTLENSSDEEKFTWAVAGRSISKLDDVLQEMSQESGTFRIWKSWNYNLLNLWIRLFDTTILLVEY